jgi:hypothetical protein
MIWLFLTLLPLLPLSITQVLCPSAPPCQELQKEEVRTHWSASPQEEIEINNLLNMFKTENNLVMIFLYYQ